MAFRTLYYRYLILINTRVFVQLFITILKFWSEVLVITMSQTFHTLFGLGTHHVDVSRQKEKNQSFVLFLSHVS